MRRPADAAAVEEFRVAPVGADAVAGPAHAKLEDVGALEKEGRFSE